MIVEGERKFTKADYLNYKKLAEKLGADPTEVYQSMLQHYKMRTPIESKSNGIKVKNFMIVRAVGKSTISHRNTIVLHPHAFTKFKEVFTKGNTK